MIIGESISILSLFCGAGGLDTGFRRAGFVPVLAFDRNSAACATVKQNYPDTQVIKTDLSLVDGAYVKARLEELPYPIRPVGVIGGPPCQAFSLSNGYKRTNDPRAALSAKYAALLHDLNSEFELDF